MYNSGFSKADFALLACLKKKERKEGRRHFGLFVSSRFGTFAMLSHGSGSLVGHENTQR